MDDVVRGKFMTLPELELNPSVVQPVASRYTDYAIPVYKWKTNMEEMKRIRPNTSACTLSGISAEWMYKEN
jgi:hypothetical protein